jgi:hypothetical protein
LPGYRRCTRESDVPAAADSNGCIASNTVRGAVAQLFRVPPEAISADWCCSLGFCYRKRILFQLRRLPIFPGKACASILGSGSCICLPSSSHLAVAPTTGRDIPSGRPARRGLYSAYRVSLGPPVTGLARTPRLPPHQRRVTLQLHSSSQTRSPHISN